MSNYHVSGKNGNFRIQKEWAERVSLKDIRTQKEAISIAKWFSGNNWGWEVRIHRENWPIRDSDTLKPGNDPRNIKG